MNASIWLPLESVLIVALIPAFLNAVSVLGATVRRVRDRGIDSTNQTVDIRRPGHINVRLHLISPAKTAGPAK